MTDDEKQYWEEWLEEHSGIMFKIEWFRIILDEAQYCCLESLTNIKLHQKSSYALFTSLWSAVSRPQMVSYRYCGQRIG